MIGDGEAETGPLAASWHSNKFLNPIRDGAVLPVLTVHDEIVIEAPENSAEQVAGIVKDTMENIFPLAVPLSVDTHWGKSWYDAKE